MKRNIAIGFGFVMAMVLPCMVHQGSAQYSEDRSVDIYHGNFTNDVRRLLNEDYYATALIQYIAENKIPMSDLAGVLMWFVDDGIKIPQGKGSGWLDRAAGAMGNLKMDQCIPFLANLAKQPDCNNRSTFIRSITRIGGSNALSFGASVISETNVYSLHDRHLLYEYTARSIMSEAFDGDVIRMPTPEERLMALGFLAAEPKIEEKQEWVLHIDEYDSRLIPSYKTNEARIVFLSYFCTNAPAKYRSQFIERVKSLRGSL